MEMTQLISWFQAEVNQPNTFNKSKVLSTKRKTQHNAKILTKTGIIQ
jgi:hypothetical protein